MAFNATYSESDVAPVAIDAVVKMLAVFGAFASLIALVFAYKFVTKRVK